MSDFPHSGGTKTISSGVGTGTKGIAVTVSATANTMGSIVELIASTSAQTSGLYVTFTDYSFVTAAPQGFLVDIMIGGAGSEVALVEGLVVFSDDAYDRTDLRAYSIPIKIPSGSRISARAQSPSSDADSLQIIVSAVVGTLASFVGYGVCESLGFSKSTSSGTPVDAGGTSNTKGAWTEIAPTSNGMNGFCLSISANLNTAQSSLTFMMDIGYGSVGNEVVAAENIFSFSAASEDTWTDTSFYPVKIPSGVRVAARLQCSGNTAADRVRDLVIHGVR